MTKKNTRIIVRILGTVANKFCAPGVLFVNTLAICLSVTLFFPCTSSFAATNYVCGKTYAELLDFSKKPARVDSPKKRRLRSIFEKAGSWHLTPQEKSRRLTQFLNELKSYLQENHVQISDAVDKEGRPILVIEPLPNTKLGRLAQLLNDEYGRKLFIDVHGLFEGRGGNRPKLDSAYAAVIESGHGGGQCCSIKAAIELEVMATEGHELVHIANDADLHSGKSSLFHGFIDQPQNGGIAPEHKTLTYDDYMGFDELLAYSYSVRAQFEEAKFSPRGLTKQGFRMVDRRARTLLRLAKRASASARAAQKDIKPDVDLKVSPSGGRYLSIGARLPSGEYLNIYDTDPAHVQLWRDYLEIGTAWYQAKGNLFDFERANMQRDLGRWVFTMTVHDARTELASDGKIQFVFNHQTSRPTVFKVTRSSVYEHAALLRLQMALKTTKGVEPIYDFYKSRASQFENKALKLQELAIGVSKAAKENDVIQTEKAIELLNQEMFGHFETENVESVEPAL